MSNLIDKKTLIKDICTSCDSEKYSIGFKNIRICQDDCLVIKVINKQKTYKQVKNKK